MKWYPHRALLALVFLLSACGGDSGVTPPPPPPPPGPVVDRVAVVPAAFALNVGATGQLQASALDAAGAPINGATFSYTSSAPTIASVSALGTITAKLPGTATITTTSGGKSASTVVTVQLAPVGNVTVTVDRSLLKQSDTVSAIAVVRDEQNQEIVRPLTWSSSDSTLAVVTPTGIVLGLAPGGPVTITATAGGKSGSIILAVIPANVSQVELLPDTTFLLPGSTKQLTLTATDEFGYPVLDRPVTWSSFNPNAATVDSTGLVTAVAIGESTISATVGGVTGQALVRVAAVSLERFRIEVTNHLMYTVEILQNGVVVGVAGAQGSTTLERPLTPTFTLSWRMPRYLGRGETFGESYPPILNPTGVITLEIDNVMNDGRIYFNPVLRNLTTEKMQVDFPVRENAAPCSCSLSTTDDQPTYGYWVASPVSVLKLTKDTDESKVLFHPVPLTALEPRTGIWRLTVLVSP